jgi:hypothetical protein
LHFHERRKSTRFQIKLSVEFDKGTGVTRDFSGSGVYFETDQSFSPSDPLEFFMNLKHSDLGSQTRVRCRGQVVRVEPLGERMGIAVAINSYGFENLHQPEQG